MNIDFKNSGFEKYLKVNLKNKNKKLYIILLIECASSVQHT